MLRLRHWPPEMKQLAGNGSVFTHRASRVCLFIFFSAKKTTSSSYLKLGCTTWFLSSEYWCALYLVVSKVATVVNLSSCSSAVNLKACQAPDFSMVSLGKGRKGHPEWYLLFWQDWGQASKALVLSGDWLWKILQLHSILHKRNKCAKRALLVMPVERRRIIIICIIYFTASGWAGVGRVGTWKDWLLSRFGQTKIELNSIKRGGKIWSISFIQQLSQLMKESTDFFFYVNCAALSRFSVPFSSVITSSPVISTWREDQTCFSAKLDLQSAVGWLRHFNTT